MPRVSDHYALGRSQDELDVVDVPIDEDIPLFVDPFAITQRADEWGRKCHQLLTEYFDTLIAMIRNGDKPAAISLLSQLGEPNETRFGLSESHHSPRGAGIGPGQAESLYGALSQSTAVKTGFIKSLEECELMVEGIGRDKISDLTTNVIRGLLASYTKDQCELWGITTRPTSVGPHFVPGSGWVNEYLDVPVISGKPLLLVPKAIARYDPSYDHKKYYRGFVIEYLRAEHIEANSSLVHTLKDGRRRVYIKDVKATFECAKERLFAFSKEHPDVLQHYRAELEELAQSGDVIQVGSEDERLIATSLIDSLVAISAGNESATDYHHLMIGVVEFLFFPNLLYPRKEVEIHDGRKRIDIVMENGAQSGIFERLHATRHLPCSHVAFECKNYSRDVANPEIDQIAGRFSPNRGQVGFLCCRAFQDRNRFVQRCRDTFRDQRGLVVPLDDTIVSHWLGLIASGDRESLDREVSRAIDEVWVS